MPRKLQPCGTPAAYERHRVRGERIDKACRKAHSARVSEIQRNRREQVRRRQAEQTRLRARVVAAKRAATDRLVELHREQWANLYREALLEFDAKTP